MPNNNSFHTLKVAVESFVEKHQDHPLLKDSIGQLKGALYDIEPVFMSPGQKAAREVNPAGQDPMGKQPVHQ